MKVYHESESELDIGAQSNSSEPGAENPANPETALAKTAAAEGSGEPEPKRSGMTRRRFMRDAAIGAAAAAAALTLKGVGGKGGGDAFGQTTDTGTVTLDGVLITYVSCPAGSTPLGTNPPGQLTLTATNTSTILATATSSKSTTISSSVTSGSFFGFTVGGSDSFTQTQSAQVTNGLTFNNTQKIVIPTPPGAGSPANTVFYGFLNPLVNFTGNSANMKFKFTGAKLLFSYTQTDFLSGTSGVLPATYDQIMAQYPPLAEPGATTLPTPRFKLKYTYANGATPIIRTIQSATGTSFSQTLTSTITSSITSSIGFSSAFAKATFSVGNTVGFTMTSVQEVTSNEVVAFQFYLYPTNRLPTVWKIYRDKIWKTYVVINAGPPASSGQPAVQGTVTDTNGEPIAGAYVSLTSGGVVYEALTGSNGEYLIETDAADPIPTGAYTITSGNITNNVTVGSGLTTLNVSGANPTEATDPTTTDGTVYGLLN